VVCTELPGTVPSLGQEDEGRVEDVLLFRTIVEPAAAAEAAAAALTARQRQGLNEALEALARADVGEYRPLDARLHIMIGEASGSTLLARAVAEARSATSDLLDRIPFLEINLAHSQAQHEQIVTAILAGDVEGARARMAEHLEGTAALLRGFLKGEG
jgi:DNA-binding FadR family transcriptional regulator